MDNELRNIDERKRKWENGPVKDFISKRIPERRAEFRSQSGIPIKRIYAPLDVANMNYLNDLGFPGEYPFTRGVYPTMYRARIWTFRPETGRDSPEATNSQFKKIIQEGATGLSLGPNFAYGYGDCDVDDPVFQKLYGGSLGRSGVCSSTLEDWEIMLDNIPLDKVSFSINDPHFSGRALAFFIVAARKKGFAKELLTGNCENDPLQLYYCVFHQPYPPENELRLAADVIEYCSRHMPRWNPISLSAYNREEGGADAIQELAFSFSDAIAVIETVLERGISIDDFAPRFPFYFSVNIDFFESVAKLRAARRIWSKLLKERFGAQRPESCSLKMHVQTAGRATSAWQPENNTVRCAFQGLSAVLGGAQSIHITTFDEPLGTPTDYSQRLSLRTHQIIAHETGVTNAIDPLGGSYFVETLTNQIEEKVWELMNRIEGMGGALKAIESGFYLRELEHSVMKEQAQLGNKDKIIVGQNEFVSERLIQPYKGHKPDSRGWDRLLKRVRRVKRERDNLKVNDCLAKLKYAAAGKENLMPLVVEAVEAQCTQLELDMALSEVWGRYRFNEPQREIISGGR